MTSGVASIATQRVCCVIYDTVLLEGVPPASERRRHDRWTWGIRGGSSPEHFENGKSENAISNILGNNGRILGRNVGWGNMMLIEKWGGHLVIMAGFGASGAYWKISI